jgi:hypothetical protein
MKNSFATSTQPSREDVEFLQKVQSRSLNFSDVLMAAPPRLLNASVEEVNFPTRFVNRLRSHNTSTLVELIRLHPETMVGKNLGARTLEVATEELKKFFVKKINQPTLTTLRDMMRDFVNDLLAREGRIFEMRMGLQGERSTLEAVGNKFGLTRERVRQIEEALVSQFDKKYPAVRIIRDNVRDGMTLPMLIAATGDLLKMNDPLPLVGILETLDPKMHLVVQAGIDPVISSAPQTDFSQTLKQSLDVVEEIFRGSNHLLTEAEILKSLQEQKLDETSVASAITKVKNEGKWVDGVLLSPNNDRTNFAIGTLQSSPRPVHIEELVDSVRVFANEEQSAEALRAALSLVPSVRWFGYGMVGLAKHVPLTSEQVHDIVAYCERVIQRGQDGYQWNVKDLLDKVQDHFTGLNISHHELNVVLHESKKLAYLGRLTWVLRGEHDEKRKLYRDIFVQILTKAGKPIAEEKLVERAKKQRGLHLNVHLRNEVEVLEVAPHTWGLTRRDHPFTSAEVRALAKAFDASFGSDFTDEFLDNRKIDRKGLKASEIAKVIEVNSEK